MSEEQKYCGIIMPIASMQGYTVDHWKDVKSIIVEATQKVEDYNFKTEIVSDSDGEIDVIHKRIIQNIYNADIVVCDISGRNPNVLFELGMRLTFDKPTIIIKDDATDFIFDTGVIEHIQYPKDLRYSSIINFKVALAKSIKQTLKASQDSSFSTFLGNFGEFKVPSLNQTPISDTDQLILDEVSTLRSEVTGIKKELNRSRLKNLPKKQLVRDIIQNYLNSTNEVINATTLINSDDFEDYMNKRGIDLSEIPKQSLINLVEDLQSELLPF